MPRVQVVVAQFVYVRRDYTPKRRGQQAGHGWIREWGGHRAEVGLEAKILVDEVVAGRARTEAAGTLIDTALSQLDAGYEGSFADAVANLEAARAALGETGG